MRRLLILAALVVIVVGALLGRTGTAQSFVGRSPAPEFPPGLDWINTDKPLTLEALRGKVVLLDFWTYGCINCIHVIPELSALEEKYADELVVIGVHSAKFYNEAETGNIRMIAERYGRTHPIVNDADFSVWRAYGVRAWPTFVLVDPEGNILGRHEGEGVLRAFDATIAGTVRTFEERGTLDRARLELVSSATTPPRTPLRFPGGVLADPAGGRLFIADSGHNRLVVSDLRGRVLEVIGDGEPRLHDGGFQDASFNAPQGLTLASATSLFVADTGNHSVRLVDLERRSVTTVAGNGSQEYLFGRKSVPAAGGLNSPWDVQWLDGQLYIAMAGQHQVWKLEPGAGTVLLHAGSGREELRDGPALTAGLNQPSGLATDGRSLYVADSEASAVRLLDPGEGGDLTTLVGAGLFDFGDVDGVGPAVRLQHPKDVAYADGVLYVADTYNHKVKRIDPETRESSTLFGSGTAGWQDGTGHGAQFYEPGGVSLFGRALYVADTNNHAVRVANLDSLVVRTLELSDPDGLLARTPAKRPTYDETVALPAAVARAGAGEVRLTLRLPEGYTANHLAPLRVELSTGGATVEPLGPAVVTLAEPVYPLALEFPLTLREGAGRLSLELLVYYCRESASELCLIRHALLELPLDVVSADDAAGPPRAPVEITWQPPPLPAGY